MKTPSVISTRVDLRPIRCVVLDFGGTLSSDSYFKLLGPRALKLVDDMMTGRVDPQIAEGWGNGLLSSRDVADYMSPRIRLSADVILSALNEGCAQITLNQAVWDFARQQRGLGRKTALVTGNFDVFNEVVVPAHGLDKVFDVIVNSCDCGTGDKDELWPIAFERLGGGCGYSNSLLIEDTYHQVDRFRELGGVAYQYAGDAAFVGWLSASKLELPETP